MNECSNEKHKAINEYAASQLKGLLKGVEENYKNEQYEIELVGQMYALMIVSSLIGFNPDVMGQDAVEAAERLIKMAEGSEGEENNG